MNKTAEGRGPAEKQTDGMEKKLTLICSLAALVVAAAALAVVLTVPRPAIQADDTPSPPAASASAPVPTHSPQDAYRLEKLNAVNDLVLDRQVVPGDYLRYLDQDLAEQVEGYNAALADARGETIRYAKGWADTFREMSPEDDWYDEALASYGRYLEEGDNYHRFIEEFSAALLYPNADDFTLFGTVVGYPAGNEMGGSGGLWATGYYLNKGPVEELTQVVEELLDRFDAARAAAEE